MKKLLAIALLFATSAAAATLTPAERDKAIAHLNQTRAAFLASIQGLTPEQWSFKPAPDVWSVGEVAEHITVSEASILELVTAKILSMPVNAELAEKTKGNDDTILAKVPDRTEKAKTAPFLEPKARWTQAALPPEFTARREKTIDFIRTTQDDLRAHVLPHAVFKAMDAYQWVLLISAHTERHIAQIDEVKANASYPKASGGAVISRTLTREEREKAVRHLNQTRAAFLASIKGLTPEQWSFKPAPDVWSVAEVAEHITVSDGLILGLVQKILASPVDPKQVDEAAGKDDQILKVIPDRSEKFKAPEMLAPKARWTQAELPAQFEGSRAKTMEFIETTPADLRSHTLAHPVMKTIDAYQWILLLSAHSQRHTAQIEEVKANANFPKS
jgi:uncharacterized damage-inducible protein DinB